MSSRFANILGLTEAEAIALLDAPSDQIGEGNSRYAAAAHLMNFNSERSIQALIRAIQNTDNALDNRIVRRKSVESLGRLQANQALPIIHKCLGEQDCYTVENAVWAIGEIGTTDPDILEDIATLLTKSEQSYRVIIQTLAKLGYSQAVERIQPFMDDSDGSIASAAIAAVSRLTDDPALMAQVEPFLEHTNVYTRRLCIQDLMDAKHYESIGAIARCPVSVVFRARGIHELAKHGIEARVLRFEEVKAEVETVLRDHPSTLNFVHEYDQPPSLEFLVRELYDTDFGRCYLATQTILEHHGAIAPFALMDTYRQDAYHDYGANYHVIKTLGWLKYEPAYDLFVEALHRTEPQFQKSRMAAAIALGELGEHRAIPDLKQYISTPIWDFQYVIAHVLQQLDGTNHKQYAHIKQTTLCASI